MKKYPVLKCNKELWNEIKPVLESFGITNFTNVIDSTWSQETNNRTICLVSNYGHHSSSKLLIANTYYLKNEKINYGYRYLVNTKEEFLSAVAKLLGKEYPIIFDGVDDYTDVPPTVVVDKQKVGNMPEPIAVYDFTKAKGNIVPNSAVKYPCIKCTQQLYDRIKDILKIVGYKLCYNTEFNKNVTEYLVINFGGDFGDVEHVIGNVDKNNRCLCSNIREFLIKACELKGFEVSYVDFVGDDNAENHYFRYVLDEDNKTITIHETKENKGECSATVTREKQWRKKPKKEDMVVGYDPAVGKDSTVVVMPEKGNDFDKDKGSDLDIDKNMEKINIANKLKHCKKGIKLYHLMFGEVEFDCIDDDGDIIIVTKDKDNNTGDYFITPFGQYSNDYPNGECLLYPSKDNRDWNSFQVLEEGHRVMVSDNGLHWSLRKYYKDNAAYRFDDTDINIDNSSIWNYIVPIEVFDFLAEDIIINKEKSII